VKSVRPKKIKEDRPDSEASVEKKGKLKLKMDEE